MNSTLRFASLTGALAAAVTLAACSTPDPYGPNNYPSSPLSTTNPYGTNTQAPAGYVEYGRITNVALVSNGTGPAPSGNAAVGTAIGAIVGGLLGNQIGQGGGRGAATVLGAVGGAAVGNRVASGSTPPAYNAAGPVYRVWVQTDSGAMRTYDVSATGNLRPGDRVRIENGVIYLA